MHSHAFVLAPWRACVSLPGSVRFCQALFPRDHAARDRSIASIRFHAAPASAIAALVDMYYLDEILVALAREIQAKGADDDSPLGDAFRSDARALRKAIGKLSGET